MEQTLNHGMCRCCASEGMFKNFSATYQWMGADEVYADMLKECFDISLTTADDWNNGGICEVCITQLRNASNFRKQVLQTEDQFKKALQDKLYKDSIVKVEVNRDEDDLDSDNNVSDFSGTEFEVPVKEELEETKTKKRTAKATTSRAKKAKTEDGEPSSKRIRRITIERAPTTPRVDVRCVKKKKLSTEKKEKITDLKKNQQNLRYILMHSNANPIRCKDSLGYICSFCPEQYLEPVDLKKHFLEEHSNERLIKFMIARLFEHVVKLDITYLSCTICHTTLSKIDDLLSHLKVQHAKSVFADIKSQIVPFKFETPDLRCAECSAQYANFKLLQEHMNIHFGHHICDICGACFITERLLVSHVKRHSTGEYKCEQCDKIFTNKQKLREHERRTHLGFGRRNKCQYCDERFLDYWKRIDHMVKEHGVPPIVLKCRACDKSFQNQRALSRHTKKDHLMERKNKCTECEMTFFSKSSLQRHMAKHTGLRQFRCDVCFKAYGRKNTLREHMRIHANDRRFACTHCDMAFVQKCSWRSHMRSKHGEEV